MDIQFVSINFIANIYDFGYCYGVSYADISTGEVYATLVEGEKDRVVKEIVRNGFREVIVNDTINREIVEELRTNHGILVSIMKDELEEKNYKYSNYINFIK